MSRPSGSSSRAARVWLASWDVADLVDLGPRKRGHDDGWRLFRTTDWQVFVRQAAAASAGSVTRFPSQNHAWGDDLLASFLESAR